MSEISATYDDHLVGTLLWIGDRHSAEFREPFEYCESHVAQLALRSDFADAIRRPANAVRCVLVTRGTRQPIDGAARAELSRQFPSASVMDLLGTLCEGDRSGDLDRLSLPTHYWYEWNQFLPQWLEPCTHRNQTQSRDPNGRSARSVAVVAATASAADPLMELATSAGAAVAWCRRPDLFRARNFDAVWWDDSVAKPTTACQWRERLRRANTHVGHIHPSFGPRQQQAWPRQQHAWPRQLHAWPRQLHAWPRQLHAWIAQSPRAEQYRQAKAGGVDLILSKPGRMDCLYEMLASSDLAQGKRSESDRRAHAA